MSSEFNDRHLSAEKAHEKASQNALLLIDIREANEWKSTGTPQNATLIAMSDADFLTRLQTLTNDDLQKPVAIICAAGGRSARICEALSSAGYDNIYDIAEGMMGGMHGAGWIAKGLPIVKKG